VQGDEWPASIVIWLRDGGIQLHWSYNSKSIFMEDLIRLFLRLGASWVDRDEGFLQHSIPKSSLMRYTDDEARCSSRMSPRLLLDMR